MSSNHRSPSTDRTRNLVLAALLAAMTAGTAWLSIPFGPVPVTLQTTFVLLTGLLLAPGWAAASMGLYLALGAVGLPVFAGGQGGLAAIVGPTGGFLVAFPIAAAAVSMVYRLLRKSGTGRPRSLLAAFIAVLVGEIVIYAIGVPWLMQQLGLTFGQAFTAAVLPFLLPDAIKAVLALVIAQATERALNR